MLLEVAVYLSSVGLGFLALPSQVVASIPKSMANPAGLLGSLDARAGSQGYWLNSKLAAPMVVNVGNLNVSWVRQQSQITGEDGKPVVSWSDYLGVRLGSLNTTAPISCPGEGVVLQLDAVAGDYQLGWQNTHAQSDSVAARIEYRCK